LEPDDRLTVAIKIEERLGDEDSEMRLFAIDALLQIIPHLRLQDRLARALKIEERLGDKNRAVSRSAINALKKIIPHLEPNDHLAQVLNIEERRLMEEQRDEDWRVIELTPPRSRQENHVVIVDRMALLLKMVEGLRRGGEDWEMTLSAILSFMRHLEPEDRRTAILALMPHLEAEDPPTIIALDNAERNLTPESYSIKGVVEGQHAFLMSINDENEGDREHHYEVVVVDHSPRSIILVKKDENGEPINITRFEIATGFENLFHTGDKVYLYIILTNAGGSGRQAKPPTSVDPNGGGFQTASSSFEKLADQVQWHQLANLSKPRAPVQTSLSGASLHPTPWARGP
jgi:hypothetical protein